MSSSTTAVHRDRVYPTRHVTHLPRTCSVGGNDWLVDYARASDLDDCRKMVLDSASRGDNVGLDEFDNDSDFRLLLHVSEIFVARERETGRSEAFMVLQPCFMTRTWDPCWAEIHIFYTEEIGRADAKAADVTLTVYSQLMKLAVEFLVMMDVGYTDCMVRVASSCPLYYNVMRRLDFVVIATIPNSVDISRVGLCDDLLFAKCLQFTDRPRRSTEQILAAVEKAFPSDEFIEFYRGVQLPTVKFLPQQYTFQTGLTVNFRSATKDDMPQLYSLMKSVTETGQGYGLDEFPTLNAFLYMLCEDYIIVLEEFTSGKLVGFNIFTDSWSVRNGRSGCCESSLVISPEFQGRGLGREAVNIELSMALELGYTSVINDMSASNQRMQMVVRRAFGRKAVIIGRLPRFVYTAGVGWDDELIVYVDIQATGCQSFTQAADYSRTRRLMHTASE